MKIASYAHRGGVHWETGGLASILADLAARLREIHALEREAIRALEAAVA